MLSSHSLSVLPKLFLALLIYSAIAIEPALAQPYESGHQPLQLWDNEARNNMPQWVSIWLAIMMSTFALGLLFVRRHVEARWVVGGFIGMIIVTVATGRVLGLEPLSGLFSLVHLLCWSPALYVLLTRRPFMQGHSLYAIWSGAITACIIFSFVFDIPDAVIYLDHMLGIGIVS
jgi:threonine/homoserine efflux transporter RhtA